MKRCNTRQAGIRLVFVFLCNRQRYIGNIVRAAHPGPTRKLLSTITAIDGQRQILQVGIPTTEILWKATDATRTPHLRFLGPPTLSCLQCRSCLSTNNPPTTVVPYSQEGPLPALVIILRCTKCNLNYHPDVFGNTQEGYCYYDAEQPVVKCTQQAYMERRLCSMIAAAG